MVARRKRRSSEVRRRWALFPIRNNSGRRSARAGPPESPTFRSCASEDPPAGERAVDCEGKRLSPVAQAFKAFLIERGARMIALALS